MSDPHEHRRTIGPPFTPRARVLSWILMLFLFATTGGAADLVVVERPIEDLTSFGGFAGRCISGSRLVHLDAEGATRILTPGFDGACDPSVSFDGENILFSGRKLTTDRWQIWRLDLKSGETAAITNNPGHAFAPLWVGSIFHLDDQKPTRRMAYLATEATGGRPPALHTANLDGSNELRISYAPGGDLAPDVLPNGRIIYPSVGSGDGMDVNLMGLGIDGTDLAAFADPHETRQIPRAVRVGLDDRVYFVETDTWASGGGELSFVSMRRPLRSREVLAASKGGLFLDPAPMSDGTLLASFRADGSEIYELVGVDPDNGRIIETVHRRAGIHVLDAHELAPRPMVRGRSTVVNLDTDTGVFFCISSHITDRQGLAHLRKGGASRLRIIEHHIEGSETLEYNLGEAPIETDGSFHIEIPAETPLRFQLLDDEGSVIAEQHSWTWVMPREWRGCIGCHEDREMVAPNILAEAVVKPAVSVGLESSEKKEGDRP